jgi:hypothetical protein
MHYKCSIFSPFLCIHSTVSRLDMLYKIHQQQKYQTQNSFRFNRRKTINTGNSALHKETTSKTRDVGMLLLLRRLDDVTFCAFERIREPKTAENRRQQQRPVCEDRARVQEKTEQQIAKSGINLCVSYIRGILWDDGSNTEDFLELLLRQSNIPCFSHCSAPQLYQPGGPSKHLDTLQSQYRGNNILTPKP